MEEGELKQAGMGKEDKKWTSKHIRGDVHIWLTNGRDKLKSSCPELVDLLQRMQALADELNAACQFESQQTQVQLACYPGNRTGYVRHLDAFVGGASRRITVLYYLNPGWKPSDGGKLRMYLPSPHTGMISNYSCLNNSTQD